MDDFSEPMSREAGSLFLARQAVVRGSGDGGSRSPLTDSSAESPAGAGRPEDVIQADVTVTGDACCLVDGAQLLLPALIDEHRLVEGRLAIAGLSPGEALRAGQVGYAPRALPAAPHAKLGKTLLLGARLNGWGKSEVQDALERCHAARLANSRLTELTPLQQRLAGLAHGLLGSPTLLVLEHPYEGLDEAQCEVIEGVLELEVMPRRWLAGVDSSQAHGRALAARAGSCLICPAGEVLGPVSASTLRSDALWVTCAGDANELAQALEATGARVTRTARRSVLFVEGSSGLTVARASVGCGAAVLEINPSGARTEPSPPQSGTAPAVSAAK